MLRSPGLEPIDYLLIGHITLDQTPEGDRLGGTALYSALTACALGLRVGLVTAWGEEQPVPQHENLQVLNLECEHSTTFRLDYGATGRTLTLRQRAPDLALFHIPELWRSTPLVHLGPVANEVDSGLVRAFPDALMCLTPQGWLRGWDSAGRVHRSAWPEADFALRHSQAVVISREDARSEQIEAFSYAASLLAVTDGHQPGTLYANGEELSFAPPQVEELDPTGAGDIFAAAFFTRLLAQEPPLAAARFAAGLAADSVSRRGLDGIPHSDLNLERSAS
ncbi:MAG: ribokinase [Anaerolineae bacterium]|nr:MAG: ribokinase [Anaerolineae bacterium]